jgi:hypothetical protein
MTKADGRFLSLFLYQPVGYVVDFFNLQYMGDVDWWREK